MTVSLLKLVKGDVKKMSKLTLGISNVSAPRGVEIGPVQVFTEQAGVGSNPGLASKPTEQLLGWASGYLLG